MDVHKCADSEGVVLQHHPMNPGSKPKPTEQLVSAWNKQKRKNEPRPAPGVPSCPAWLKGEGYRLWQELMPLLLEQRTLALIDRDALARYCQTWKDLRKAQRKLDRLGHTYECCNAEGYVVAVRARPEVGMVLKWSDQLTRAEAQFGMTPSARASLGMELGKHEEKDPTEEKHFGKGKAG